MGELSDLSSLSSELVLEGLRLRAVLLLLLVLLRSFLILR